MSSSAAPGLAAARGVIRLLNTAGGRLLCLAGEVDAAAVEDFRRWYGAEPAHVDGIDMRSVTFLSTPARRLVRDHLAVAERAGRRVAVRHGGGPGERALHRMPAGPVTSRA